MRFNRLARLRRLMQEPLLSSPTAILRIRERPFHPVRNRWNIFPHIPKYVGEGSVEIGDALLVVNEPERDWRSLDHGAESLLADRQGGFRLLARADIQDETTNPDHALEVNHGRCKGYRI